MKTPKLKFDENHKPLIEGDFEFKMGEVIFDDSLVPKHEIIFALSVEMQQDMEAFQNNQYREMDEALGEKLKQNFLEFLRKT